MTLPIMNYKQNERKYFNSPVTFTEELNSVLYMAMNYLKLNNVLLEVLLWKNRCRLRFNSRLIVAVLYV